MSWAFGWRWNRLYFYFSIPLPVLVSIQPIRLFKYFGIRNRIWLFKKFFPWCLPRALLTTLVVPAWYCGTGLIDFYNNTNNQCEYITRVIYCKGCFIIRKTHELLWVTELGQVLCFCAKCSKPFPECLMVLSSTWSLEVLQNISTLLWQNKSTYVLMPRWG